MKLRNKKTGEAVYVDFQIPLCNNNEILGSYCVMSLKELNKSFEDYEPAEPLIKYEKVRKAVRAWAEVNNIERVFVQNNYCLSSKDDDSIEIVFARPVFKDYVNDEDFYDIDELCGVEEE